MWVRGALGGKRGAADANGYRDISYVMHAPCCHMYGQIILYLFMHVYEIALRNERRPGP